MEQPEDIEDDEEYFQEEEEEEEEEEDYYGNSDALQGIHQTSKEEKSQFTIKSMQQVQETLESDLEQISSIIPTSKNKIMVLFQKSSYSKDKLLDLFINYDNLNLFYSKFGVSEFEFSSNEGEECEICFGDVSDFITLKLCGHSYCTDCYTSYLTQKIKDEGEVVGICCMNAKCSTVIDGDLISEVMPKDLVDRFKRLSLKHYVDSSANMRYCCNTKSSCSMVAVSEQAFNATKLQTVIPVVHCTCGTSYCFGCGLDQDHSPCICILSKLWLKKNADDSETSNWIQANTKECTKCNFTIEKNGGCNHMTCKNCKYEFCWVCMGPWSEHGNSFYNCNRYNEKSSLNARDTQAKSRAQLDRYLHYFNRYANHEQSSKLASVFSLKTDEKMEELQKVSDYSWIEVQFMKKGLEVVLECRMVLKWTYAFAYYLDQKHNHSKLFSDNQTNLEVAVESLNELIERPLPNPYDPNQKQLLQELKQMVLDKSVFCKKRLQVLLEDTRNGLKEGRWKYNVELR